jgi:hypothetical protein
MVKESLELGEKWWLFGVVLFRSFTSVDQATLVCLATFCSDSAGTAVISPLEFTDTVCLVEEAQQSATIQQEMVDS